MTAGMYRIGILAVLWPLAAMSQVALPRPGQTADRDLPAREVHRYSIAIPSDHVYVVFRRLPFVATVKLLAADGRAVAESSARLHLVFSAANAPAGQYTLEVSVPQSQDVCRYRILNLADSDERRTKADALYYQAVHQPSAPESRAQFDSAAALYGEAGQPELQGSTLMSSAQTGVQRGEWSAAAERFSLAAPAFGSSGDAMLQAQALADLSSTHLNLRDFRKAIEAGLQAAPLARASGTQEAEISALSALGSSYVRLGNPQRALDYLEQALAVARKLGNMAYVAQSLTGTGLAHRLLGNYGRALELYSEADRIYKRFGDKRLEPLALNNLGIVYHELGDNAKALESYQQAMTIARTGPDPLVLATSLAEIGALRVTTGEPGKAIEELEEALGTFRRAGSRWDEASVLTMLGRARFLSGDTEAAEAAYNDALAIRREVGDPNGEAGTRYEIARLERSRGNLEAARGQTAAAIDLVEALRNRIAAPDLRSSLLASAGEYYTLHVNTLMQLYHQSPSRPRLEEAFQAAERERARSLLDVLTAARVSLAENTDSELATREQTLRRSLNDLAAQRTALFRTKSPADRVAALEKGIDAAWTDYQAARAKLAAADPQAVDFTEAATLGLNEVQREALDPDTLLLEYSLGEQHSYVWAVSQNELHGYELAPSDQIEAKARAFWEAVKSGSDMASVQRAGTRLSGLVLGPVRALLGNRR
ncbi:MAG TPA: tetratricopeptide repeat protein, partial [Candidatus Solibacter sp.]|nr:tetratricopeptide repeat protein [Candidatus Solibacter sp.]